MLVDKLLVMVDDNSGWMCYWLCEMMCYYVLEKFFEVGEVDVVFVWYCDYYMVLVVRVDNFGFFDYLYCFD